MKIAITDTRILLEEADQVFTLLEKLTIPDYQNVTKRPYIFSYYEHDETIWDRFCLCMERLPSFCPDDPYLGGYALILRRLYPLLLSSSQVKNVIAYGAAPNCGAYPIIQDFMTFLQKGSALTVLALSPFSLTAVTPGSCAALLYRLDTCPALTAVCDAIGKVRPGGRFLLYTIKETLPTELAVLCGQAEKDSFASCTLYTLTVDDILAQYARENGTEAFLLSQSAQIAQRVNDLKNLVQAVLAGWALQDDAWLIAAVILQQIEELLLSLYDYLEDDELPVRTNRLKEGLLNYFAGTCHHLDTTAYREKLTSLSEDFFAAIEKEFS